MLVGTERGFILCASGTERERLCLLTLTVEYRRDTQNGPFPNSPLTRGKLYMTGCDQIFPSSNKDFCDWPMKVISIIEATTLLADRRRRLNRFMLLILKKYIFNL